MADSVIKTIALQRSGLQTEISTLEARLEELRLEVSKLDQAEATLRGMSLTTFKQVGIRPTTPLPLTYGDSKLPTIKQMVLLVLNEHPDGLVALDILSKINSRYECEYVRTSLSPQLSRLKQSGQIHKKGKCWILGPDPLSEMETPM